MHWRQILLGIVVLFVAAGVAILGNGTRVTEAPPVVHIGFEPSQIGLGQQLWNDDVAFELTFVNDTENPIVVKELRASCGCTTIDKYRFAGLEVSAGSSIKIPGVLDTQFKPRAVKRKVTLETTTGERHTALIRALVQSTYRMSKPSLEFEFEDEERASVQETSVIGEGVTIVSSRTDLPWLSSYAVDEKTIAVQVDASALPGGRSSGRVNVHTTDESSRHGSGCRCC